jgi:hypothetical protein
LDWQTKQPAVGGLPVKRRQFAGCNFLIALDGLVVQQVLILFQ